MFILAILFFTPNLIKLINFIFSATTSINSLGTDSGGPTGGAAGTVGAGNQIPDSLDAKIDCLLRDWHHSPDLLFSVHPIDGSYLIWYEKQFLINYIFLF